MPALPSPPNVVSDDGTRLVIPGRLSAAGRDGLGLAWDAAAQGGAGGLRWASAPGGLLGVAGAAAGPLALGSSPVTITPGSGIIARQVGRSIVLDAPLTEPVESLNLWSAGAASTAGVIGTWRNTNRSQNVYLRKLLVNLRTAQTVADVANYYRVKVTDALGALAVIPMTAVGARTYLLDRGIGSIIERGVTPPNGGSSFTPSHQGYGVARSFTAAQTLTITGVEVGFGVTSIRSLAAASYPSKMRCAILDNVGNVIASAYVPLSGTDETPLIRRWPFTQSAVIVPNSTYFLAFDIFENAPARDGAPTDIQRASIYQTANGGGAWAATAGLLTFGGAYAVGIDGTAGALQALPAQIAAITWPGVIAGTQVYPPNVGSGLGGAQNMDYRILGSPAGLAQLSGDLTFSVDPIGAPVAGASPTDVSLMAILASY